jgi:transglutaminase-like putative cysteine protease
MRIKVGYNIRFAVPAPTPMQLLLNIYPGKYHLVQAESIRISPEVSRNTFSDTFGNTATRLLAPAGQLSLMNHAVVEVDGLADKIDWSATQVPVHMLPIDTLGFLTASRYCEVDKLTDFAWGTFGNGTTGALRVQAICDFVHRHIEFGYAYARPTKSAHDVFLERRGVCRDFAHLAISLCRCMGLPARYATGYLGDIGIPINPAPMDFSAWFEVYLSNGWVTFDARFNMPRIGRIVMAYGKDATDAALTTSFGPTILEHFAVTAEEMA